MSEDDDLLKRFAALRPPQTDLSSPLSTVNAHVEERARKAMGDDEELERIAGGHVPPISRCSAGDGDGDADFKRRIARLKGISDDELVLEDDGDQAVEDFLASIAAASQDQIMSSSPCQPTRTTDILGLEREARAALHEAWSHIHEESAQNDKQGQESEPEPTGEDEETEEEIMARASEEASLERLHDPSTTLVSEEEMEPKVPSHQDRKRPQTNQDRKDDSAEDEETSFSFPTLPSHVPADNDDDDEVGMDEDTRKRLDMLLGLKPSIAKPGQQLPKSGSAPPPNAPRFDLPGYNSARDEDTESWCCICNRDASLVCLGCDDDLYCEECWRDGHGQGEGQEVGHRVKRFVWGNKRASAV
ncbi:hypothetical protein IAR55_005688 [Kwoniella newhampshirensis]|uniref:Uncharacterized protein n=1 Tax=Kwoniella newhampshirensis TaxID=1651941 RepID=A0AAW0YVE6_9TREE